MNRRQFLKRASGLLVPLAAPAIIGRAAATEMSLTGSGAASRGGGALTITTIRNQALTSNNLGTGGWSLRIKVVLTGPSGTAGQVRVTFEAGSGGGSWQVDHASIGVATFNSPGGGSDTLATPVELLFSGASGFTLGNGLTLVSDWATLGSFLSSDVLCVIADQHATNDNTRYVAGLSTSDCYEYYLAATASYATASGAGFNSVGGSQACFNKIETR
jgi:hypothetical protein